MNTTKTNQIQPNTRTLTRCLININNITNLVISDPSTTGHNISRLVKIKDTIQTAEQAILLIDDVRKQIVELS